MLNDLSTKTAMIMIQERQESYCCCNIQTVTSTVVTFQTETASRAFSQGPVNAAFSAGRCNPASLQVLWQKVHIQIGSVQTRTSPCWEGL